MVACLFVAAALVCALAMLCHHDDPTVDPDDDGYGAWS